jgi:hypothetical protein
VTFGAAFSLLLLLINEMINLDNTFFFWVIVFLCVFLAAIAGYFAIGAVFGVVCALILDELFIENADPTNTLFRIVAIIAGKVLFF